MVIEGFWGVPYSGMYLESLACYVKLCYLGKKKEGMACEPEVKRIGRVKETQAPISQATGSKVVEESSDLGFMARSWVGRESREKAWSRGKRKLRHRGYLPFS